jgi:hypothetical protein
MNIEENKTRRQRYHLGMVCINMVNYSNPMVIAFWSFMLPGFGYSMLGQFVIGWILFIWEVGINVLSNLNTAIMYTLTGRFEEASRVLSQEGQWKVLIYGAVYIFSIAMSYAIAVEVNHLTYLAHIENSPIHVFSINSFQYNFLTKRDPWTAATWSLLMPGLGSLYNRRIVSTTYLWIWWIIVVYNSNVIPSIYYSAIFDFNQATSALNPEWFLFIPSIYGFSMHLAYTETVENNKIFEKEQANFIGRNFQQDKNFPLYRKDEPKIMRIIATFDSSSYVEMALVGLQQIGIPQKNIYAASLDKRNEDVAFIDTIHRSDGTSIFDVPAILATIFMLLGGVYGFILKWGPIIWSGIGFIAGFSLGFTIKLINLKLKQNTKTPKTDIVIIVDCKDEQTPEVEKILWKNMAFGISKTSTQSLDNTALTPN